ncbi:sodium:solute symporter family protein [Geoalkalibacter halelectricus]|uniref:Sodium:solute symporter family protein n=1 Tax=Geoalkalibacter halelectricus TaxID=2847045 RepID=A0ABY5ZIQ9_9BACT|nr:sodium:solute symporter family protein [Geoalkalibacter halelectricus]MDO3378940.1 sodium:solute symporter family protein [Geoalkalibacter halelectricus]UWZ79037.1 sodium:solute symporter family protein [Geoalkalibacter halelectricus]
MSPLLLGAVVAAYLCILAGLALKAYRETRTGADYLVAGRRTHPFVMAMSYGATFVSTSAIIGFGGAAALFGMGLLWLTFLTIFVGIFVAFVFFGRRTRIMGANLNAQTFPEFIGLRFQSRGLQGAAGLLIFVAMPLYAGVVLMGGGKFIAQILQVDYHAALLVLTLIVAVYVILGGIKGVMYTDAFQGSIMFAGMVTLLVFTYYRLGGVTVAHERLTGMKDIAVSMFGAKGHTGWTSFPTFMSEYWLVVVTTIILGVGIGVLAQPQLIVRFMTVRSDRELNRAVLIGGVFILVAVGVAFIVGPLANVFFYYENPATQGQIALLAANRQVDAIIPLYIGQAMPPWFAAIFMVTLLSAAMSTLSSQFHTMGTSLGRDLYEGALGRQGNSLLINKVAVFSAILISYALASGLPLFFEGGTAIIARGTAIFFGICAAAFLPMYFGAIYFRGMTRAGAWAGFITGTLTSLFWIFFIHVKESRPLMLCQALFGVDSLAGDSLWAVVDPLVVALPASIAATLLGNALGAKISSRHLVHCFRGIARAPRRATVKTGLQLPAGVPAAD